MKTTILLATLLLLACSDAPGAPLPKVYSWQDCDEDIKPAAQAAFEECLNKVDGAFMPDYLEGERFTPRNCEQYAIALYCIPSSPPRCEKEIVEAVNDCDEEHEGERRTLKAAYDKLSDQFNSCKARENELSMCAGFGAFADRCYKKHATELVEGPDDTPPTN